MRFSLSDGLVTILAGLLSGLFLFYFFLDLNAISSHGSERELGTIVFRKQTATRKSSDSQVWERLRNQSPVYQSDTLRTADGSEAVVNFADGLSLDILQNTMLKLTMKGRSKAVDFSEGSITLRGSSSQGPIVLGDTGKSLVLSPDAQVVLSKKADTMSLELSQGTASVGDGSGSGQEFSSTRALELDTKTGKTTVRPVDLIPRSPVQGARLLNLGTNSATVPFTFQVAGSLSWNSEVELQVSGSPDFSTVAARVPGVTDSARVPLSAGDWYWRLVAGKVVSSVRQFTLAQEESLALGEPADKAEIAFRKRAPSIRFSWSTDDLAVSSTLELASGRPDFRNPRLRRRTTVPGLQMDSLGAGTWYWRVVPEYEASIISANPSPEVRSFTIVRRSDMAAIEPQVPVEGTLVQTQELAAKGLAFTWSPVPEAQRYELAAYANQVALTPLVRFTSTSPYLLLSPEQLGPLVREGVSFWDLRWVDDEGNVSPAKMRRSLHAVDGKLALRLTYPPDEYKAAEQFLTNTRFSWKSNLKARTVFQVSRTSDFAQKVFEDAAPKTAPDWEKTGGPEFSIGDSPVSMPTAQRSCKPNRANWKSSTRIRHRNSRTLSQAPKFCFLNSPTGS